VPERTLHPEPSAKSARRKPTGPGFRSQETWAGERPSDDSSLFVDPENPILTRFWRPEARLV
jgi:hypothetical protein